MTCVGDAWEGVYIGGCTGHTAGKGSGCVAARPIRMRWYRSYRRNTLLSSSFAVSKSSVQLARIHKLACLLTLNFTELTKQYLMLYKKKPSYMSCTPLF